jgi:CBS domain containing-hemolysin-like protein
VSDEQEEFKGDATLEDLLSKFSGGKRDRRRRQEEEEEVEEEGTGDRYARRQRDAIRRTLQQLGDDD